MTFLIQANQKDGSRWEASAELMVNSTALANDLAARAIQSKAGVATLAYGAVKLKITGGRRMISPAPVR